LFQQRTDDLLRRQRNHGSRTNTAVTAGRIKGIVILRRNHAADELPGMSSRLLFFSSAMTSGTSVLWPAQETKCQHVDIVSLRPYGHIRAESGQRADVDIEPSSAKAVAMIFAPRSWPSWPS